MVCHLTPITERKVKTRATAEQVSNPTLGLLQNLLPLTFATENSWMEFDEDAGVKQVGKLLQCFVKKLDFQGRTGP